MITVFRINRLKSRNRTDRPRTFLLGNPKPVRLYKSFNCHLVIVSGFDIGGEHLHRVECLDKFLLICENVRFVFIAQIVINHAPNRRVSRSGHQRHNFNGMLSVENIVNPVPSTDFYRVNLI